jgi:hypothetical protein
MVREHAGAFGRKLIQMAKNHLREADYLQNRFNSFQDAPIT